MAVNEKSNLLECIFISKKSLEIGLNLTSQIKQFSLTHFVFIVTEPNLEACVCVPVAVSHVSGWNEVLY